MTVPDYSKSLQQLRSEWEDCTACELGSYRQSVGGAFVFGAGTPGAIMLIGEGPGAAEEAEGKPFVGHSGQILHKVLHDLGMQDIVYFTNSVSCRSCAPAYDSEGRPLFFNNKQRIEDRAPSPTQTQACAPRLYEEIYLVDPVLIVTLGVIASELLLQRSVSILTECGSVNTAKIPGAGWVPKFTDKKHQWRHKVRKEWVAPIQQNQVEYLCIPCLHPAFVARNLRDRRQGAAPEQFVTALTLSRDIYHKYVGEVFGDSTLVAT